MGGATGNFEICIDGRWLSVCISTLFPSILSIACRALGFGNELVLPPDIIPPVAVPAAPIFADELICSGSAQNFTNCEIFDLEGENFSICNSPSSIGRVRCPGEYCHCQLLRTYSLGKLGEVRLPFVAQ